MINKAAVVHSTPYDGTLERACLKANIPTMSVADSQSYYQYTLQSISNQLLDDWKRGIGAIGKMTPRYQPEPLATEHPADVPLPSLAICLVQEGHLCLSGDSRSKFINDPIRGPEWRKLLQAFDSKWSATGQGAQNGRPDSSDPGSQVVAANVEEDTQENGDGATTNASWDGIFDGEPTTKDELGSKYGPGCQTFSVSNEVTGIIMEGPKLFFLAISDCELTLESAILFYGAGTWLLDAKASAFEQDASLKGVGRLLYNSMLFIK